jgi:ectoine hydroxylase-related dioxygenase (phytanoyl-CoA dioxygenase family)
MRNASVTDQVDTLERNGFSVCRDRIEPDLIKSALAEYEDGFEGARHDLGDTEEPVIVFWSHHEGGRKRMMDLRDLPAMDAIVRHPDILATMSRIFRGPVRFLEAVVFNKPPIDGKSLAWHQDMSFYPLQGGRQVSAWVALDPVTPENGAVSYAAGSHLGRKMGAVDLKTGTPFADEDRPIIPTDPMESGYAIETPSLDVGDYTLLDGYVWHASGENKVPNRPRRVLSIRYFSEEALYVPRPTSRATFTTQIRCAVGGPLHGKAFPVLA